MSARIQLPNGPVATMSDEGLWSCEGRADIAELLQSVAGEVGPHSYMADPFHDAFNHVVKATGAHIVEYVAPPFEYEEGKIY